MAGDSDAGIQVVASEADIRDVLADILPSLDSVLAPLSELLQHEGVISERLELCAQTSLSSIRLLRDYLTDENQIYSSEPKLLSEPQWNPAESILTEESSPQHEETAAPLVVERRPSVRSSNGIEGLSDEVGYTQPMLTPSAPNQFYEDVGGKLIRLDVGSKRQLDFLDVVNRTKSTLSDSSSSRRRDAKAKSWCHSARRLYIHPDEPRRLAFDAISFFLILVLIVTIPFELSFLWGQDVNVFTNQGIFWVNTIADAWFGVDILLNFFTAFYNGTGDKCVLETRKYEIFKNYMKGWFWIDFLAIFPFEHAILLANAAGSGDGTRAIGMVRVLKASKVIRILKVLRVFKLGGLTQQLEEQLVTIKAMTVAFQLLKLCIVMLLASHGAACVWFFIGLVGADFFETTWLSEQGLEIDQPFTQWIASFYFAITTGTTVGYGDISATNPLEQGFGCMLLVGAVAYIGSFLAKVGQAVSSLQHAQSEMLAVKREAMIFMRRRGVPRELYRKILRYIEHHYDTESITSLGNATFMEQLSASLQKELRLVVMGNVLTHINLFQNADSVFVRMLCEVCKTLRAGVGDVVVYEAEPSEVLYMIVLGEVMLVQGSLNICVLGVGDWFGEESLFSTNLTHPVSIQCQTASEFLVLSRQDFKQQVARFPKIEREYQKLSAKMRPRRRSITSRSAEDSLLGFQSQGGDAQSAGSAGRRQTSRRTLQL